MVGVDGAPSVALPRAAHTSSPKRSPHAAHAPARRATPAPQSGQRPARRSFTPSSVGLNQDTPSSIAHGVERRQHLPFLDPRRRASRKCRAWLVVPGAAYPSFVLQAGRVGGGADARDHLDDEDRHATVRALFIPRESKGPLAKRRTVRRANDPGVDEP